MIHILYMSKASAATKGQQYFTTKMQSKYKYIEHIIEFHDAVDDLRTSSTYSIFNQHLKGFVIFSSIFLNILEAQLPSN